MILIFSSFVNSIVLGETAFSDLGQSNFELDEQNSTKCFETLFSPTVDLNKEIYSIASVHAEFLPISGKKSFVEVFLNNEMIGSLKSTEFLNGFGRYNIEQGKVLQENVIKICATTSFEVSKINILNDSMVGYYKKSDFKKEGAFQIIVEPEPRFLEEFVVKGVLKNFGSEDSDVILKYRKDELEKETPETELIKGETKISRTILMCQTRNDQGDCIEPGIVEFEYKMRPKLIGPISLLPAIVEFENLFGETIILESNRPAIRIVEPEIKIKPFIQIEKEQFLVGEKVDLRLLITNEGQNPLFNLSLKLGTNGLELLKGSSSEIIEIIQENETISREFTFSSIEARTFTLGCSIDYLDYNVVQSACNEVVIEYNDPAYDITLLGAGVLVLLSIVIYVYIHLKK